MKKIIFLWLLTVSAAVAQTPQVPGKMEFGGIRLNIDEPARREIQESVDALTANPKYFNVHVQRARSYFPIIERIFREENLPEDFKYLVLQESALIPDAVSSSDAVGFWQFKDFTAREMGLRVDRQVDERMNIVASSRAAARYLKKNNERYFDNWVITLMAYQMGPGAAIRAGGEKYKGQRTMTIDRRTYWYIKKFLAHKVAFESFVDGPAELSFVEITNQQGKSLEEIAREANTGADKVSEVNKWLRRGNIPDDRDYVVLLPVVEGQQPMAMRPPVVQRDDSPVSDVRPSGGSATYSLSRNYDIADPRAFPLFDDQSGARAGKITEINGRPAVIARLNDRVATLAGRGGISVSRFLRFNDMEPGDRIQEGQVYYLKKKPSRPRAYYHAVEKGEDLWDVSQKYGLRLSKLKQRNRIRTASNQVNEGRILWLRYIRPSDVPVEYKKKPEPVLEEPSRTRVAQQSQQSARPEPSKETPATAASREDTEQSREQTVEKREWRDPSAGTAGGAQKAIETDDDREEERTGPEEDETIAKPAVAHRRIIHRVQAGETFYAVSRKFGVDIQDILEWNKMEINDPLAIGQELIILKPSGSVSTEAAPPPAGSSSPAAEDSPGSEVYVVQNGDTLYGIARKFNLTVTELKQLNGKSEDVIKPGEKLKVSR